MTESATIDAAALPGGATGISAFIARWQGSSASERSNYQLFLIELCEALHLPRPEPATGEGERDLYVFERPVQFRNPDGSATPGFIDLYRHGSFVLETKQGSEAKRERALLEEAGLRSSRRRRGHGVRGTDSWDAAMLRARGQAEQYAKALPEWPPFLVVIDVGHSIETWADFTGAGKYYAQFPDAAGFRMLLPELANEAARERLRGIWLDPLSLDPSRHAARVTREIARRLALLGRSLEAAGHNPERVALFLMRSLFTMFAEDVGLLRKDGYRELLRGLRGRPQSFAPMMRSLWSSMDRGGFSPELGEDILRFNGGLFEDTDAIALDAGQLDLLIDAAEADWSAVEPAIFGTLLEQALTKREREQLGAHYTPRLYVERLVLPTVIEPLRSDWEAVKAAAV
ncbi:MAG TPA: type IIL restriction-modification enzyme MmeI, partial [Xanthobacteraceae bacterium]